VNGEIIHLNAIPRETPRTQLVSLRQRYSDSLQPEIRVLPAWYRDALIARIAVLLEADDEAVA
jgi:hypothetical protein